jgi:HD-like signal output (HDOD) protein
VVGAIVAKTWHLPRDVAVAIRLHHDFSCLGDTAFPDTVRQLVALGLIADHLVGRHEGVADSREWVTHGAACLAHLDVTTDEVELWVDELHPQFEAVTLA